ncbi:MAG: anti-sigma factor [Pseudonocardiales bacterium]
MDNDDRIAYLSGNPSAPLEPDTRAELDQLRGVLADPAVWVEPPPALEDRIVTAVAQATRGEPVSPAGSATVTTIARQRRPWIPYAVLGVAAAAVLAVVLTFSLAGHAKQSAQYAASLDGTKLAPSASGQVTLTRTTSGWKIRIQGKGLPRRDGGEYYEAWLKNASGVLVPIGTFNQVDDVTLWAGVSPADFPTLTVTRQVAAKDQASSGQVVLLGVTHRTH